MLGIPLCYFLSDFGSPCLVCLIFSFSFPVSFPSCLDLCVPSSCGNFCSYLYPHCVLSRCLHHIVCFLFLSGTFSQFQHLMYFLCFCVSANKIWVEFICKSLHSFLICMNPPTGALRHYQWTNVQSTQQRCQSQNLKWSITLQFTLIHSSSNKTVIPVCHGFRSNWEDKMMK